jgi:histidinol dehydrogenase
MKMMRYADFKNYKRSVAEIDPKYFQAVTEILERVKKEGDDAILYYAEKFDKIDPKIFRIEVSEQEKDEAKGIIKEKYQKVFDFFLEASKNIREYHENQREKSWEYNKNGCIYGQLALPLERAGLYVPGGKAFYPSSVLMNLIPAKIAGVPEIYISTPPDKNGGANPLLIALADELGATKIFKAGGAQAIAAFAYGTETIPRVAKITGPGNLYVATAKRLVMGQVGIDSIAGSSEVMLLADESADPHWAAIDLCAQAEHDSENTAVLVSTSEKLIKKILQELDKILPGLARKDIIKEALDKNAFAVIVDDYGQGFDLVNRIAPEHIEVMLNLDRKEILSQIKNAGAVFIGNWTPVAASDYYAGPNHVIPTNGTAAFSSPLGVYDFMKHTSFLSLDENYIRANGSKIAEMAEFEKFDAHAKSVLWRMEK